jgi:hypothetical protein
MLTKLIIVPHINFSIRQTTGVPFVLFFMNISPAVGEKILCIEINCTLWFAIFCISTIMDVLGCTRNQDFMFVILVQEIY